MNKEIETRLDEIFEEGKKMQAQIADFYTKVCQFSRLVEFDERSEAMKANIMKMHEALREVVKETMNY